MAGQHRSGRAQRADGAIVETGDDGIGEVDREFERLRHRRDADRLEAGDEKEQRGAVRHLGLALAAAGDLGVGIGLQPRRIDRIAEHVAIGLGVAAVELAHDRGELARDVLDRPDAAVGDGVADGENLAVVVPRVADDQLDAALLRPAPRARARPAAGWSSASRGGDEGRARGRRGRAAREDRAAPRRSPHRARPSPASRRHRRRRGRRERRSAPRRAPGSPGRDRRCRR